MRKVPRADARRVRELRGNLRTDAPCARIQASTRRSASTAAQVPNGEASLSVSGCVTRRSHSPSCLYPYNGRRGWALPNSGRRLAGAELKRVADAAPVVEDGVSDDRWDVRAVTAHPLILARERSYITDVGEHRTETYLERVP